MVKNTSKTKMIGNRLSQFSSNSNIAKEAISLLQESIRINTTNPPGNELPLAIMIQHKFEQEKNRLIKIKLIETKLGRGNVIVDIKGSEPNKYPCWGFASHLDVVPVSLGENWSYPPFSGEIVELANDKFIWGRGSFDMKYMGVSMIIAILTLLREGFQPKANIKFIFESDEERGGQEGMKILVNEYWEDIKVECLISEGGGYKLPIGNDFIIQAGEKGKCQTKIRATGIAGHGSTPGPYEDFAIYKLVKILEHIKKSHRKLYMIKEFKNTINAISLPKPLKFLFKRKMIIRKLLSVISNLTHQPFDEFFLPMITDTIAPTIITGGSKENVINPHAELTLDIRTLPGHDHTFIYKTLQKIIGKKLFSELEFTPIDEVNATTSPINTIFYQTIFETAKEMYPGANLVPILDTGGTDMKFHRMKGIPCYGFCFMLKDPDLTYNDLMGMSHAPNERVSVNNLMLATEFYYRLIKKL